MLYRTRTTISHGARQRAWRACFKPAQGRVKLGESQCTRLAEAKISNRFGQNSVGIPLHRFSPLCRLKRESCSRFALVATVSAFCWPWAFRYPLPTTTADSAVIMATTTGISRATPLASLCSNPFRARGARGGLKLNRTLGIARLGRNTSMNYSRNTICVWENVAI